VSPPDSFKVPVEYHATAVKFKHMVEDSATLDRVYRALGDPTRRRLLVALRAGEARITDLAAPLPMSFAAVARHVGVLEDAGLVARSVRGREHWLSLRPDALAAAEAWIADQTTFWAGRADALADRLGRSRP
jgi:DNA-binding transcriptional ArsR family regulator